MTKVLKWQNNIDNHDDENDSGGENKRAFSCDIAYFIWIYVYLWANYRKSR